MRGLLILSNIIFCVVVAIPQDPLVGGGDQCMQTMNPVVDLLLGRYGSKFDQLLLPNITTPDLALYGPVITGMSSITRSCDINLNFNSKTKVFEASICLRVAHARLLTILKLFFRLKDIVSMTSVNITNLVVTARASAQLEKGGPLVIEEVKVTNIDKINVDNSGLLGAIDFAVNAAMKLGLKNTIIRLINENVAESLNAVLKLYPF